METIINDPRFLVKANDHVICFVPFKKITNEDRLHDIFTELEYLLFEPFDAYKKFKTVQHNVNATLNARY